jgi:hypothetical protein
MPNVIVEKVDGDSDRDNENDSDECSEDIQFLNYHKSPRTCPGMPGSLPRPFKSDSREFLLYHAIVDQVLSLDVFEIINWTDIAKTVGYNGRTTVTRTNELFAQTWKVRHGGSLTKHTHLFLAIIDELSGEIDGLCGNWTKLASALRCETESVPRMAFKRLWGKYLKITRPEVCIPVKKSRGEKVDEWIANMQSFDDGDDDGEPLPLYEEHDSRVLSIKDEDESVDETARLRWWRL